jgi:hypothetical protein
MPRLRRARTCHAGRTGCGATWVGGALLGLSGLGLRWLNAFPVSWGWPL